MKKLLFFVFFGTLINFCSAQKELPKPTIICSHDEDTTRRIDLNEKIKTDSSEVVDSQQNSSETKTSCWDYIAVCICIFIVFIIFASTYGLS